MSKKYSKQEVIDYVIKTPANTNPAVLNCMLENIDADPDKDYNNLINKPKLNGAELVNNTTITYSDLNNKPKLNGNELTGDTTLTYNELDNKPSLNGVELSGDTTLNSFTNLYIGSNNRDFAYSTLALGHNNTNEKNYTFTFGNGNYASGKYSISSGEDSWTIGDNSIVWGKNSTAAENSLVIGENSFGSSGVVIGNNLSSFNKNTIKIGNGNSTGSITNFNTCSFYPDGTNYKLYIAPVINQQFIKNCSKVYVKFVDSTNNRIIGLFKVNSIQEENNGLLAKIEPIKVHKTTDSFTYNTTSKQCNINFYMDGSENSIIIGGDNITSNDSIVLGNNNTNIGSWFVPGAIDSIQIGKNNRISAEKIGTILTNDDAENSITIGNNNNTTQSNTVLIGNNLKFTNPNNYKYGATIIGKYNSDIDNVNYSFIIGNGTSDTDRQTILKVRSDGTLVCKNVPATNEVSNENLSNTYLCADNSWKKIPTKEELIDEFYPVGAVYTSVNGIPKHFPGTWEKIDEQVVKQKKFFGFMVKDVSVKTYIRKK